MNSSNLVLNHLGQSSAFNTSQKLLNDLVKESLSLKGKVNIKDVDVRKHEQIEFNSQVDDVNQKTTTNKTLTVIDISDAPSDENINQEQRLLCDESESLEGESNFKLPNSLIKSTITKISWSK